MWLIVAPQGDRGEGEKPGMVGKGEGHSGKDEQALRWKQVIVAHLLLLKIVVVAILTMAVSFGWYITLREFLENMKKRQEQKVNDLLEDNKELLESIKKKAADTKEVIEVRGREFDQMMEKTVCEAI